MLHRTITHLQTRPHHERRAVALVIAVAVMAVIFLVWVVVFFRSVSREAPLQLASPDEAAAASAIEIR